MKDPYKCSFHLEFCIPHDVYWCKEPGCRQFQAKISKRKARRADRKTERLALRGVTE